MTKDATLQQPSMNSADKELFTQSWNHYGHLEDQRHKMLTFFSTLLLSGLTAAGFLVKTECTVNSNISVLFAYAVSSLISTFGLISTIYIVKCQAARSAYGTLIDRLLRRSYGEYFDDYYRSVFHRALEKNTPPSISYLFTYPRPFIRISTTKAVLD